MNSLESVMILFLRYNMVELPEVEMIIKNNIINRIGRTLNCLCVVPLGRSIRKTWLSDAITPHEFTKKILSITNKNVLKMSMFY